MREVLAGGNLPPNMRAQAGWIGGFKTLVGQEIRRDPCHRDTFVKPSSCRTGTAEVPTSLYERGPFHPRTWTSIGRRTQPGGFFSHSSAPAPAPLRGVRQDLGFQLPATAGASRGTLSQRQSVRDRDIQAIVMYVMSRIKGKDFPPIDQVRKLTREAAKALLGGGT